MAGSFGLDHLIQDKDQSGALVDTVVNQGVPYKAGDFFTN
jgi:hypothetical protein